MAATEEWIRGDSYSKTITFKHAGTLTPYDITGWTISITIKGELDDIDAAAQLHVDYTVPVGEDATAGIATVPIPASATASLVPGTPWRDIQVKIPNVAPAPPTIKTIQLSKIKVLADVTLAIPT